MNLVLKAILGGDGSGFELMIKRAKSAVKDFNHSLADLTKDKIAELFGLAALEEGGRRAIEYAHRISSVSKQMGISTDEAQALEYQMDDTTGSLEEAAAAYKKLGIAQAEAARGNHEFRDAFRKMGINPDEASGMSRADLFKRVGGYIGQIPGELSPNQQDALQKLMGRGADSLIPSFKMGQPKIPSELIIPEGTIDKLHGYSGGLKNSGRALKAYSAGIMSFIVESLFSTGVISSADMPADRKNKARQYIQSRVSSWLGLDEEAEKKTHEEMEQKLKAAKERRANPNRDRTSISVDDINPGQLSSSSDKMTEIFNAAKLLSLRGKPQIQNEVREIMEMRNKAAEIMSDGSNPLADQEATQLRFGAYNRVRSLLNPFPERINLNGLQSAGLERVNTPVNNLTQVNQRLVIVLRQLTDELIRAGVPVPRHSYSDTNYR